MIIHAVLYSPLHPASSGGVPFFERSITNFESKDHIPQTGARQLIHILRDLKDGDYAIQVGHDLELTLNLPCEEIGKHLGRDKDDNMTLEMNGTLPEVTDTLISALYEDGWTALNSQLFFDIHGIIPAHVH